MELKLNDNRLLIIRKYREDDFKEIQQLNKEEAWNSLVAKNKDTKEAWANSNVAYKAER